MRRIWELSGSDLATIWEPSERQLGYMGYMGSQGALSHLGSYFVEKLKEKCKSSFKMSILRCVFEGRCHGVS